MKKKDIEISNGELKKILPRSDVYTLVSQKNCMPVMRETTYRVAYSLYKFLFYFCYFKGQHKKNFFLHNENKNFSFGEENDLASIRFQ